MPPADFTVLLDALIRGGALSILVVIGIILVRDHRRTQSAMLTLAFALGLAAYLVCASALGKSLSGTAGALLEGVCSAVPALFWFAALALFDDEFRIAPRHLTLIALLELLGPIANRVLGHTGPAGLAAAIAHGLLVVALFVHVLLVAWRGRAADLVERRKAFRVVFVGLGGAIGLIIGAVELAYSGRPIPTGLDTVSALGILAAALWLAPPLLKVRDTTLFVAGQAPGDPDEGRNDPLSRPRFVDQQAVQWVTQAMAEKRLYRTPGLTIGSLASSMGIAEHQLRRAINGGLGYRNFNAFLNHYRIEEIRQRLSDPNQARIPVLTIALDTGFASLAPFNRAFRAATGQTPTDFRRQKLEGRLIDSEKV